MSYPKPLKEKLTKYDTDNFDLWLQKTNVVAREEGDLNNLDPKILSNITKATLNCNTTDFRFKNKFTVGGSHNFSVGDEIFVDFGSGNIETRLVVDITVVGSDTIVTVNHPFIFALNNSTVINLTHINLVSAMNRTYNTARNILIKAIAMS